MECSGLANINLSNFVIYNVTYKCSGLTNINLSNFNTNNVTDMSWIFGECSNLKDKNIKSNDKKILNRIKSYLLMPII